jgi:hypothetical protein
MAIKGWGRIGIVLSVIWFLGFGVYLFAHPTSCMDGVCKIVISFTADP